MYVTVLKWSEGDHPREPAGSERGGEFTRQSGRTPSRPITPRHLTSEQRLAQAVLAKQSRGKIHQVQTPEEGVMLILQGKNVELQDPKDVHTILKQLGELAIEAKKQGKNAPNFDVCQISVKGTNLFCSERIKTKDFPHGLPRIEMPQFKSKTPVPGSGADKLPRDAGGEVDATDAFLQHLDALGVKTNSYDTVLARKLRASQSQLEGAKVAGMMVSARDPKKARIVISQDDYVVDGHHTWAAAVGRDAEDGNLDNDMEMDAVRIALPMSAIYHQAVTWTKTFGLPAAGVKKQDIFILKFDPQQARDPKGSPTGGQFTRSGAGKLPFGSTESVGSTPESRAHAKAQVDRIKTKIALVNNDLLDHVSADTMASPDAGRLLKELKGLQKEMYRLDADPGGFEGIGLPGGPRDVVIVGAGPGGLSAAINGGTEGLDTLFIDASTEVGGQAKFSSRIENFAGFPGGISGETLARNLHEQAQRVGAEGLLGVRVTGLTYDANTGLKTLTLSNGQTIESRSVVLANGLEFKQLEFPGSTAVNVSTGDGKRLAREGAEGDVIVVGGSNGAAQAALGAAKKAKSVTVLARSAITKSMSASQVEALVHHPKITIIEGDEIASVQTDEGKTMGVTLKSGRQLPAKAVGLFVGNAPMTEWLPPDVKDAAGRLRVNNDLETSIPGVFAVGDVRAAGEGGRTLGRVGAAVGEGQVAIANVFQYFRRIQQPPKPQKPAPLPRFPMLYEEMMSAEQAHSPHVHKSEVEDREAARKARARTVKEAEGPRWDALVDAAFALDEEPVTQLLHSSAKQRATLRKAVTNKAEQRYALARLRQRQKGNPPSPTMATLFDVSESTVTHVEKLIETFFNA